jgi:hypothetical protein
MIKSIQITKKGSECSPTNESMFISSDTWNPDGSNLLVYVNDNIKRIDVDYTIKSSNSLLLKDKPKKTDTIIFYITNLMDQGNILNYDERMQQLDKISKKLDGKAQSSIKKRSEEETIISNVAVHSDNVWVSPIPEKADLAIKNGVAVYKNKLVLTEDMTVPGHKGWFASTDGTQYGIIKRWISPEFGINYTARLYDNQTTEITSSDAMRWHFDYQSGYLTIENDFTHSRPFALSGYEYVGKRGVGSGTYWKEPVYAKSELPITNNEDGDMRLILTTNKVYKFDASLVKWVELEYGSSQYRDPVETFDDIPTRGNKRGDIRFVLDEKNLYMWTDTEWLILTGQGYDPNNFYPKAVIDEFLRNKASLAHVHDTIYYRKEYVDSVTRWRTSVATSSNLPPYTENENGDVILTRDNNYLYRWYSDDPNTGQGHWENILQATYSWKTPVPTANDLPKANNVLNDCRIVSDEGTIYFWDGTEWLVIKSSMQFDGAAYVQKNNLSWKEPVNELPTVNNNLNDIRLLLTDNKLYKWNGILWDSISGGIAETVNGEDGLKYLSNPIGSLTDLPTTAELGTIIFIQELNALYSFNGSLWEPITLNADDYYTKDQINNLIVQCKKQINYNDLLNIPLFYWKRPVYEFVELTPVNNNPGDVKLVLESKSLYAWNGSEWDLIFSGEFLLNHEHDYSTVYYTIQDIDSLIENIGLQLEQKAQVFHSHDDYYIKSQVDEFLAGKADIDHLHEEYALVGHAHPEITNEIGVKLRTPDSDYPVDWTNVTNTPDLNELWKYPVNNESELPASDAIGSFRLVLENCSVWRWNGTIWVKFGAIDPDNHYALSKVEQHVIDLSPQLDGVEKTFYIGILDDEMVFLNGLLLIKDIDYTFNDEHITLLRDDPPESSEILIVRYMTGTSSLINLGNGEIAQRTINISDQCNGVATTFYVDNGVTNENIFLNGVLLIKDLEYTLENGVITLFKDPPPESFDILTVNYLTGKTLVNLNMNAIEQHVLDLTDQLNGYKRVFYIGDIYNESVFLNGILLIKGSDYTFENGNITLTRDPLPDSTDTLTINYITGNMLANSTWKDTVDFVELLPIEYNKEGDVRLVRENNTLYTWRNGNWESLNAAFDIKVATVIENINNSVFSLLSESNNVRSMGLISWNSKELEMYQGYVATDVPRENSSVYFNYIVKQNDIKLYHDGYFTNANNGELELMINNSLVDSFSLADAFVISDFEKQVSFRYGKITGGARQEVGIVNTDIDYIRSSSTGQIRIVDISKNVYKDFQKGKIELHLTGLSQGYNEIKVIHRINNVPIPSNVFKVFVDSNHKQVEFYQEAQITNFNIISNKWLSGIRYYSIGDMLTTGFESTSFAKLVYNHNPFSISFPAITDTDFISDNLSSADHYTFSVSKIVNINNVYDIDAKVVMTINDFFNEQRVIESPSRYILINTVVQKSTALIEYFVDEVYRLPIQDYDSTINIRTNMWKSNDALTEADALIFDKKLMYADLDTLNFNPYQPNNYKDFSNLQTYIRSFVYAEPHSNCIFIIDGITLEDLFDNKIQVYVKLPSVTGWIELNKYYNVVTFKGQDGDGCLTDNIGNKFYVSFGRNSTLMSNYTILIKIVMNKLSPDITYLECKFKE